MNLTETKELLALIASYDRRPFAAEAVGVWHGELRDVELEDAAEAVKTIFRTNGHDDRGNVRTLLPADVRRPAQAIAETRYRRLATAANRKQIGAPQVRRGSVGRPAAVEKLLAEARAKAAAAAERYNTTAAA
jgi:hypothetical protein